MEENEPFTIEAAWTHLRYLGRFLFALFASPAALAARLILTRARRLQILQWLAPLEAAARRLILIEAALLPASNAPPARRLAGRLANAYADRPQAALPENPEEWRVAFSLGLARAVSPARNPDCVQRAARGDVSFNAHALARRIEALRRLMEDRAAALARAARRFHADRRSALRLVAPFRHRSAAARSLLRRIETETARVLAGDTS